jgi:hypothetical protein
MSREFDGTKNLNEINAVNKNALFIGAGIYAFSPAICGIKTTFSVMMNKTTLQRFVDSLLLEQQRWVDRCL